jgi:hypothetical protein
MAIKVANNTVINDSLQLQNIASVDSTTETNLKSDLSIPSFSFWDKLYTDAPSGGGSLWIDGGNIQGTGFTAGSTGVIGIYSYQGTKSNRAGVVYTGSTSWFTNNVNIQGTISAAPSALIHKGGGTTQWVGPISGLFYLEPNASITAASTDTRTNNIYYRNI